MQSWTGAETVLLADWNLPSSLHIVLRWTIPFGEPDTPTLSSWPLSPAVAAAAGHAETRRDSFFSLFLPSGVETPRDLDTKRVRRQRAAQLMQHFSSSPPDASWQIGNWLTASPASSCQLLSDLDTWLFPPGAPDCLLEEGGWSLLKDCELGGGRQSHPWKH